MSASSAITSIVYSLLQKSYLKARLRKELTWLFSSTERKPLHIGPSRKHTYYQPLIAWRFVVGMQGMLIFKALPLRYRYRGKVLLHPSNVFAHASSLLSIPSRNFFSQFTPSRCQFLPSQLKIIISCAERSKYWFPSFPAVCLFACLCVCLRKKTKKRHCSEIDAT